MTWWQSIILGIVEGVTEYLPVSSTGHLTITEKLMGMRIDDPGVTAYTAIIQIGAILAAILYFREDIIRIATAFLKGLGNKDARDADYNMGWAVVVGTVITAGVALLGESLITGALRSMWVVATGLIVWSFFMFAADRYSAKLPQEQKRGLETITWKDGAILGLVQCLSLVPGVSRSGATITGGLFSGLDRVAATKLSFYLGIPALVAAGVYQAVTEGGAVAATVGWGVTLIGTVVSFFVAYASIAWLLKYVASNSFTAFVIYRIVVGLAIFGMLFGGVITAN
ncbi:undecaprenyl-diphosphate phosphatase [Luteococcus sp. Sow4_B9]|uniref:undecaprenyl-diphosphate phosphatase n=1 Tax=Luteococcus sp. Sow4_B9 TaxID=3438792 RepID=UPI003F97DBEC